MREISIISHYVWIGMSSHHTIHTFFLKLHFVSSNFLHSQDPILLHSTNCKVTLKFPKSPISKGNGDCSSRKVSSRDSSLLSPCLHSSFVRKTRSKSIYLSSISRGPSPFGTTSAPKRETNVGPAQQGMFLFMLA